MRNRNGSRMDPCGTPKIFTSLNKQCYYKNWQAWSRRFGTFTSWRNAVLLIVANSNKHLRRNAIKNNARCGQLAMAMRKSN